MTRTRSLGLLIPALVGALALTYCGGGGGGGSSPTAPMPPTSPPTGSGQVHVVQIQDDKYEPKSITIQPGDTVRWVLSGSTTTHSVTGRDGSFDSGFVFTAAGATYERRFDTSGTVEYSCRSHSLCCLMRGSIKVGNNSPPPDPTYE
jgi:plastocyanin